MDIAFGPYHGVSFVASIYRSPDTFVPYCTLLLVPSGKFMDELNIDVGQET